ncbi:MtrAB system histidine kinase MtrB [Dermatophilus congolensis]|nr:MtrAB system histidine kinase MtrB [Dermatophilus congolensis]MBO3142478.1 HAMP domain-containing histidine kinase [Dermatophilus congolensis]MBO3151467.1 HAMP domain-containing histidine kinase [Dermatophilus congolensis]MBO3161529.1 HAMP domain-containing histidine kinase [Dermatophilus congolensis]MBO3162753.1 HAMP domain-containing histidine kinase [Dermatophilus congolensis]MBO3176307.1 HAMP domain-containing histidine kinase [Dermatophilus congolensis]
MRSAPMDGVASVEVGEVVSPGGEEALGVSSPVSQVQEHRGWKQRVKSGWRNARAELAKRWRTSLQFRTVVITVVLGAVITVLLQSFSYSRTAAALVEGKVEASKEDAAYRASGVQRNLDATDRSDAESIRQLTYDLMQQQTSQAPDQAREVILTHGPKKSPGSIPTMWTAFGPEVLPQALREAVVEDPGHQQVQIVPVRGHDGSEAQAVVVGQQIQIPDSDAHELYFVYPMEREASTMDLMLRTYLLGGVLLTGLIALVSLAVTRLVVDPVREAAQVAERLANGRLDERMQLRGEDDLARLSGAFNRMADNLQSQIRRLEELSQVQQRFVSDVSHELRTPLTTIQMASEMLFADRDAYSPTSRRSAELLHGEVERFDEMLSGLLEISRHDAGSVVLETDKHDVVAVVQRVISAATTLAETKGSEVTVVELTPGPFVAEIDPRRIERILRNLLVNALEHGQGEPVQIEVGANEEAVAVAVRDHGIGLEPGQSSLVFNRFWRADPARTRTTGGTGLGLAIALEDARLHRGLLQAWGVPGEGSRFRLIVPKDETVSISEPPIPLADGEGVVSHHDTGTLPVVDGVVPGATVVPVDSDSQGQV